MQRNLAGLLMVGLLVLGCTGGPGRQQNPPPAASERETGAPAPRPDATFSLGPDREVDAGAAPFVEIRLDHALVPTSVESHLQAPGQVKWKGPDVMVVGLGHPPAAMERVVIRAGARATDGRRLAADSTVTVRRTLAPTPVREEIPGGFRIGPFADVRIVHWLDNDRIFASFRQEKGDASDFPAAWSPDGSALLVASRPPATYRMVPLDGSPAATLPGDAAWATSDLLVSTEAPGSRTRLLLFNRRGEELGTVASGFQVGDPVFSPDWRHVAAAVDAWEGSRRLATDPPATYLVVLRVEATPGGARVPAAVKVVEAAPAFQPVWMPPPVAPTADLPTFPAQADRQAWAPGRSGPAEPSPDAEDTLAKLAAHLEHTGSPEVPEGVPAVHVGALEGGYHVYNLGYAGRSPGGNRLYMLSRGEQGRLAVPICEGADRWVWAGTREQNQQPVVVCAASEGSGSVMTVAVYKAGREVFRAGGLVGGTLQVEDAASGPPPLVMTFERQWMDHKLDPTVRERFTFRWDGGTYTLAGNERMADASYHLARFLTFLAAGDLEGAAGEMAAPPAAGLAEYLCGNAPGLPAASGLNWTTEGYFPPRSRDGRVYLHRPRTDGPWLWFEFTPDGRVKAVGEQNEAPK